MRILDMDNDKALTNAILYLKPDEAQYLIESLENLIKKNEPALHSHINDKTYEHEITVYIYDENKLEGLGERSKIIIKEDI